MNIDIVFAEFGNIQVDTDHYRKYFPEARLILISDQKYHGKGFDRTHVVRNNFRKDDPRYGWHMNDYWQVQGMIRSDADICLAFDADTRIVSQEIRTIIPMVEKFGLVLPANSRMTVRHDAAIGADGGRVEDATNGNGFALNCAVTGLNLKNPLAFHCAFTFCKMMEKSPARGPLVWHRAIWETGFTPYLLPFNWLVCENDIGVGNEIMLHAGHEKVKKAYNL
jgi:hypothetical protein